MYIMCRIEVRCAATQRIIFISCLYCWYCVKWRLRRQTDKQTTTDDYRHQHEQVSFMVVAAHSTYQLTCRPLICCESLETIRLNYSAVFMDIAPTRKIFIAALASLCPIRLQVDTLFTQCHKLVCSPQHGTAKLETRTPDIANVSRVHGFSQRRYDFIANIQVIWNK